MRTNRLFCAGVVLGVGFGGFFDGIMLHQILGWHHLICRTDTCQPTSLASLQEQNQEDGWLLSSRRLDGQLAGHRAAIPRPNGTRRRTIAGGRDAGGLGWLQRR